MQDGIGSYNSCVSWYHILLRYRLEYNFFRLHPTNFTFASKNFFPFKLNTSTECMFMLPLIKFHSLSSGTFCPSFCSCPLSQIYININSRGEYLLIVVQTFYLSFPSSFSLVDPILYLILPHHPTFSMQTPQLDIVHTTSYLQTLIYVDLL